MKGLMLKMEMVDKFDSKRQPLNKIAERHDKIDGEYRQSVHTWILNSKGEFLIQKRTPNKRTFPNMWSQTGGAVDKGESTLQAALRECKEELGIDIPPENMELIVSFKRKYDFVDVWLVRQDIDIEKLVLQEDEVADAKWATVDEIRGLMKSGELAKSIDIYFDMFLNLLDYPY